MADVDIGRLIRGRAEVGRDEAVSQREFQSESTIVDIHASANHEHWHNGSTMGEVVDGPLAWLCHAALFQLYRHNLELTLGGVVHGHPQRWRV